MPDEHGRPLCYHCGYSFEQHDAGLKCPPKPIPDLDLLSPLVARARNVLVGKSRSYVTDAIDFARALVAGAEELERLRTKNSDLLAEFASSGGVRFLTRENERLQAENERLVKEYAEALVRAGGVFLRTTA